MLLHRLMRFFAAGLAGNGSAGPVLVGIFSLYAQSDGQAHPALAVVGVEVPEPVRVDRGPAPSGIVLGDPAVQVGATLRRGSILTYHAMPGFAQISR